jgi:DNA (cytosine-5)-methyltransferase 1
MSVTTQPAAPSRKYGVKLVRGPFVRLAPHKDSCADEEGLVKYASRLRSRRRSPILGADLFCGAGGLSLGLERAGFRMVLAVDHDREAIETHRHLFGGLTVNWDLSDADNIERVASLMRNCGIQLLAGGPPCQPFSKAGRSMIRHRVQHGLRAPHDERRDLWQSFIEVVRLAQPRAVVMENVPDMALDREMFILRTVVHELESLGYAVEEKVTDTWRYGVPQFRQRLLLVALSGDAAFEWPLESEENPTVWNAIGDLPEVEGGWRPDAGAEGWAEYEKPITTYQRSMREGVPNDDTHKVFDHITRPVRPDDELAFMQMDPDTRYSELSDDVRRYRDDIFDDKYKRLDEDYRSRTITAHIAKDGYWYIHPRQNRTLTIREAARLQTFPDHIRFAGPPSAAFRQIGNAVPPLLAEHLGQSLRESLQNPRPRSSNTMSVAAQLARWFAENPPTAVPWLAASTRWQVVCGDLLLDRASTDQARLVWPLLTAWPTPDDVLAASDSFARIAGWVDRSARAEQVLETAEWLASNPDALKSADELAKAPHVSAAVADLATLVVPSTHDADSEDPVLITKGTLRVAARYSGHLVDVTNRLTDGRLEVARLIGADTNARTAHLALMELANRVCQPNQPDCGNCPLAGTCATAER